MWGCIFLLALWVAHASPCLKRISYWQDVPLLSVEECNNHYDLGVIQGTTFGNLIRARVADSDALSTILAFTATPYGADVLSTMRAMHQSEYPYYMQELNGLAAGSQIPFDTLFALNLRNELLAESRLQQQPQQQQGMQQQQQQSAQQGVQEQPEEQPRQGDPRADMIVAAAAAGGGYEQDTGEGCSDVLVTLAAAADPDATCIKARGGASQTSTAAAAAADPLAQLQPASRSCWLSHLASTAVKVGSRAWSGLMLAWTRVSGSTSGYGGWDGSGTASHGRDVSGTSSSASDDVGACDGGVTSLLGHNEDVSSDVVGRMYVLRAQMVGHPTWVALVYPGELASTAFGLNTAGVSFTLDALYPLEPLLPGHGRNFLSRAMLDAPDMAAAHALMTRDLQATGRSVNLLDLRTCALSNMEVAPGGDTNTLHVDGGDGSWAFHANHYQRMDVPEQPGQSSAHREAVARAYPPPASIQDVLYLLGDTTDEAWPIYRTGGLSDNGVSTACTILITATCSSSSSSSSSAMDVLSSSVQLYRGDPRLGNLVMVLDGHTLLPRPIDTEQRR